MAFKPHSTKGGGLVYQPLSDQNLNQIENTSKKPPSDRSANNSKCQATNVVLSFSRKHTQKKRDIYRVLCKTKVEYIVPHFYKWWVVKRLAHYALRQHEVNQIKSTIKHTKNTYTITTM